MEREVVTLNICNLLKEYKFLLEVLVNGGRNYNGLKVAKFFVW